MKPFSICFRTRGDVAYTELLSILAESFREQCVLPFLGAGLSRDVPSGLPMAKEICEQLVKVMWASVQPVIEEVDISKSEVEFAYSILAKARLERLLDALQQVYGQKALEYLQLLNSERWNENHAFIAALCREGMLGQCITLNFDLLIEYAAREHGVSFQTICPLVSRNDYPEKPTRHCILVIKPHGSFEISLSTDGQLSGLRTTISQLGTEPHPLNEQVLSKAFDRHTTLFVAGYSDDDWDIFPIIVNEIKKFRKIVWVQYADSRHIIERKEPTGEDYWSLHYRIKPMLQHCGVQSILVYAKLKDLFSDIKEDLGIQIGNLPSIGQDVHPDASIFTDSVKNALATSILLQHTGEVSIETLSWLGKQERVKREPNLQWQVEYLFSHTEHTKRKVYKAIPHMKRAIRILEQDKSTNRYSIAKLYIWLGYEYLCLAKRPLLGRPWLFLFAPLFILKGNALFRQWSSIEQSVIPDRFIMADDYGIELSDYSSYYRADLLHAWANLLMLMGPKSAPLIAPLFAIILRRYEAIALRSRLMTQGYYLLRMIEARLLCGDLSERSVVDEQLNKLENQYRLTQENVQAGNINAYRALMFYVYDKDKVTASKLLSDAVAAWERSGKSQASGFDRVRLFSRFMGL